MSKSSITSVAWLAIVAALICIIVSQNSVEAFNLDAYTFPSYGCGSIVQPGDPLGQARKTILINVVTVHSSASHKSEFTTCINQAVSGQTMYAAASCTDPTSDACNQCLQEAQAFLDHNCLYFDSGSTVENAQTCTMTFGTSPKTCKG
ncbi:hypothetical protein LINPERPRIM_LOCUS28177 [Linum perenne]